MTEDDDWLSNIIRIHEETESRQQRQKLEQAEISATRQRQAEESARRAAAELSVFADSFLAGVNVVAYLDDIICQIASRMSMSGDIVRLKGLRTYGSPGWVDDQGDAYPSSYGEISLDGYCLYLYPTGLHKHARLNVRDPQHPNHNMGIVRGERRGRGRWSNYSEREAYIYLGFQGGCDIYTVGIVSGRSMSYDAFDMGATRHRFTFQRNLTLTYSDDVWELLRDDIFPRRAQDHTKSTLAEIVVGYLLGH